MGRAALETVTFTRTYPGRADQVSRARREVAAHLTAHGCTVTDDAVLIVSELASNAVLHSRSKSGSFTVRTEIFPTYLWLEVEDLGGDWTLKPPDDRMHGLDVMQALTGPGNWGTETMSGGHRVVWARLELAQ